MRSFACALPLCLCLCPCPFTVSRRHLPHLQLHYSFIDLLLILNYCAIAALLVAGASVVGAEQSSSEQWTESVATSVPLTDTGSYHER